MSHLSPALAESIGLLYFDGWTNSGNNPIVYALGISQAVNSGYLYVSLHTGSPGADTVGTEVTTAEYIGYARAAVRREKSFASPGPSSWANNAGLFENRNAINFPPVATGGTGGTLTHWGIYDAATGGNLLFHGPMNASGATYKIGYSTGADAAGTPDTDFVFSEAHGLSNSDTIRMYGLYDATLGSGSSASSAINGAEATLSGVATDSFNVSVTIGKGAILFIKSASIALAVGKIPSIPAGGMKILLA
jgi:hypothetical protein